MVGLCETGSVYTPCFILYLLSSSFMSILSLALFLIPQWRGNGLQSAEQHTETVLRED